MKKYVLLSLLFLVPLTFIQLVFAGTTGKIAGIVVDKSSGEPLLGANVVVEGTSFGAATDQEGQYTILYVPPGVYNVQVFVIGYTDMTVENVPVHIDQTARIDFELEVEVVQGEEITVVAERTAIRKDVATSVVAVSSDELEALPVNNVEQALSMQAGIEDGFKIRGSEGENVLLMLDGVTMRDPRNNEPIGHVALSAVKEISIERGGFNAEYGQVQAGIVNIVTREGHSKGYHGSFQYNYGSPAAKYFQIDGIPDVHDADSYWMRPFLDDEVCWTGTDEWDQYTQAQYLSFVGWNAVSEQLLADSDPTNDLTPLGCQRVFLYETRKEQTNDLPDYNIDAGFGGPVPFVSEALGDLRFFTSYRKEREVLLWSYAYPDYVDYDWSTQLTSNISDDTRLRMSFVTGNIRTLAENWNYGEYPRTPDDLAGGTGGYELFNMFSDWAWSVADIGYNTFSSKLTHTISPKTFYEVSLEYLNRDYDTGPTDGRDTTKTVEILPGYWVDEYPLGYWPTETVGVTTDIADGIQASLARDYSKTSSLTLKANLTSQVNFNNLVKTGVEFVYSDLDLDYGFIQMQTGGKTYGSHIDMEAYPVRAAAYIQDKLETEGFTMNAGLRLDYSDSKIDWWNMQENMYNAYFISSMYDETVTFNMVKSKAQWQISPRLGISHPITENSKLFFNYGHFKQMPQYETLFRVRRSASGNLGAIGDPNLTLAKTISYELGYDHVLFHDYLLQAAAFYKDISDQQNVTTYESINGNSYDLTTSNGYEDIRGFELTLRKSSGRWFSGFMNYTYQVSSSGFFGREEVYQDPSAQQVYDEETTNLYQERPTPAPFARANVYLRVPNDYGPSILHHRILGGWGLNFLFEWSQGGWTTYNPKNVSGIVNNVQFVDTWDGTLRFSKTFVARKFNLQFMVDVTNVFNTMQLRHEITDNVEYRASLHLPENEAYDNIPGDDRFGDYRKAGVEWQPIEYRAQIEGTTPPTDDTPIYYEGSTGDYYEIVDEQWTLVEESKINQVLEDKAYIYNAGPSTYWFLNPRAVIFGIRLSFDLN